MKVFRWFLAILTALVTQFVVSTIIYNIQHFFNIFYIPIIFIRHYLSVYIGIKIGILIAPGSTKNKSKIFITFYSLLIIGIIVNLLLEKAEAVRISSAIIECLGILIGAIVATNLISNFVSRLGFNRRKSIFTNNKYADKENFPAIISKLAELFKSSREDYILGSFLQLKREGVDVSNLAFETHHCLGRMQKALCVDVSNLAIEIPKGSELEDILKGFELTSMIGIAWDYIESIKDKIAFDRALSNYIGVQ